MTDESTPHILKAIQNGISEMRAELTDNTHKISLLADGILSLRQEVRGLDATVETLAISTAGHGERLAHVEDGLTGLRDQISKRLPQ